MNIVQIEENVKQLIQKIPQDDLFKQDFIYELLLAYGHRSQSVGRVRSGERNLAEDKENSVFWKRQLYFKISNQQDLHSLIDQMKKEKRAETNKIRFLIVTDFNTFLAIDTKTQDTLDIQFCDLAKKFDFFLPWAGMEKAVYQGENPADVKAAEKLAKLFDEIKADNFDEDDLNNKDSLHQLNIFLSRLLFCYFAEDTEIFKAKQFTSAISKSNEDGSDLSPLIDRLFKVLNQSTENRETNLPDYLADFPYVNGGLFKDDIQVPKFTRKSRRILLECGAELDWSDINPDIFGSMFQAVVHTEQRSMMGQHYTSVPNIMKVIEPLFLNDLYEELERDQDSVNKLLKLQQRLSQMTFFDPACGSGNFLIIAYKELRMFEMELLKRVQELELEKNGQFSTSFSVIQVSQFFGIEIDDFATEIAMLSLLLAEHQMNIIFKDEFGESRNLLPLRKLKNIINSNALDYDWSLICNSKNDTYILGNPPFVTYSDRSKSQKEDMDKIFKDFGNVGRLDYVACWFKKGIDLVAKNKMIKLAFVATNSICQGEQVQLFWPYLEQKKCIINFAHQTFPWSNNARSKAGVSCVIVGVTKDADDLFIYNSNSLKIKANYINYYLEPTKAVNVQKEKKSISNFPEMILGSSPIDGGNLILTKEERDIFIQDNPKSIKYIKPYLGGADFLDGVTRYCIWIEDDEIDSALSIPLIKARVDACKEWRKSAGRDAQKGANVPHRFFYRKYKKNKSCMIIPMTSSSRRTYLPVGIIGPDIILSNGVMVIYDAELYMFSILSSKMHMLWVKAVSGKLRNDIRYNNAVCYNCFPFPQISKDDQDKLNESALNIISIRERYSSNTLAKLYNTNEMPDDLKQAHQQNDTLIERFFSNSEFDTDLDRINILFATYLKMSKKHA